MIDLPSHLLENLKNLSVRCDFEICGFIIKIGDEYIFKQKNNLHPKPIQYFLIDPKENMYGKNIILFHSHPSCSEGYGFSDWDIKNQEYHRLDMLLYCVNSGEFYYKKA